MVQCLSTSLLIVALPAKINEEDLRKMNLVAGFEALDYHEEFTSNDEPDVTYTWVTVNDTKMAAKIVYDLLTGVFKKNLNLPDLSLPVWKMILIMQSITQQVFFLGGERVGTKRIRLL